MNFLRWAPFLSAYRFAPHRVINGTARYLARARRPQWAVQAAIAAWIRRDGIDMTDFEPGPFATLEAFFLRRLLADRRPLGKGMLLSPVDGRLVAGGVLTAATTLPIKSRWLSLDAVVNGRASPAQSPIDLHEYVGGQAAVIFLSPRGYHRVHMPTGGTVREARWIPGRYFPQNEQALQHIDRVHERNERLVLRCQSTTGGQLLLIMVGASVIGGINLTDQASSVWRHRTPTTLDLQRARGEELGHFTFGSTVVVAIPRNTGTLLHAIGTDLKMGATLFAASGTSSG